MQSYSFLSILDILWKSKWILLVLSCSLFYLPYSDCSKSQWLFLKMILLLNLTKQKRCCSSRASISVIEILAKTGGTILSFLRLEPCVSYSHFQTLHWRIISSDKGLPFISLETESNLMKGIHIFCPEKKIYFLSNSLLVNSILLLIDNANNKTLYYIYFPEVTWLGGDLSVCWARRLK